MSSTPSRKYGVSNVLGRDAGDAIRLEVWPRLKDRLLTTELIEAGELTLVYQPVIATKDRTLVGLKALVRWEHPEWGPIRPDRFLDVAERAELVLPMGAWVLGEACGQLAAWSAAFPDRRPPTMAINVSLRELAEPGYPGRVAAAAKAAGVAPDQLVLEAAARVAKGRAVSPPAQRPGASITLREAAGALGASPSTLRRWSDAGRIDAVRTAGGHRRFLSDDVHRLRAGATPSPVRIRSAPWSREDLATLASRAAAM